ncbi:hypothetical protein PSPO01_10277 [Paraphaeosphaeria sporulosa]
MRIGGIGAEDVYTFAYLCRPSVEGCASVNAWGADIRPAEVPRYQIQKPAQQQPKIHQARLWTSKLTSLFSACVGVVKRSATAGSTTSPPQVDYQTRQPPSSRCCCHASPYVVRTTPAHRRGSGLVSARRLTQPAPSATAVLVWHRSTVDDRIPLGFFFG